MIPNCKKLKPASKLETPVNIKLSGCVNGTNSFDGSEDVIISNLQKGCLVNQQTSTPGLNIWFKFADCDVGSVWYNNLITFIITGCYSDNYYRRGILNCDIRQNEQLIQTNAIINWTINKNIPVDSFVMAYKLTNGHIHCELYCSLKVAYESYHINVLNER